jgi:CheY-like chemotaxis protein
MSEPRPAQAAKPITLALVDDDPGHLELLRRIIRRAGFDCALVMLHGGQDALDYLDARGRWAERAPIGPTVMLLDVRMPGGPDGFEVLARIRVDPASQHILVILHTGADEPNDAARAQALGCMTMLAKPADHATIVATLAAALAQVT